MKSTLTAAQAAYGPAEHKSFAGALGQFFADQCPQLGGTLQRQVIVRAIGRLVEQFYPATTNLRPGQTTWACVQRTAPAGYGQRLAQTPLTQVTVDLVRQDEAAQRAQGTPLRELKRAAVVRLFRQAYEQDGVFTHVDVALLLKLSPQTVGKYVREWEAANQQYLPRRGTIHDLGPTLTHKDQICRKVLVEGLPVEVVARLCYHSPEAVHRYVQCCKQVWLCRRKGLTREETAFAVRHSPKLVDEYWQLLDEFQAFAPDRAHALDALLREDTLLPTTST